MRRDGKRGVGEVKRLTGRPLPLLPVVDPEIDIMSPEIKPEVGTLRKNVGTGHH